MNIEELKPYAKTKAQLKYINAVIKHGSPRKAAKEIGCGKTTIYDCIKRVKINAAKNGFSPDNDMTHISAPGFSVNGVSTLYNSDGNLKCQWVKTNKDKDRYEEQFNDFIEGLCEGIKGKSKTTKEPEKEYDSDLMSAIIIGDAHIGMIAYSEETKRSDFDTDIAVQDIRDAVDNLVDRSPNSETGVLVDVGDLHHSNNSKQMTGNETGLEADTRQFRVLKMSGMVIRYSVNKMLKKFKKVRIVISKGNHNPEPAIALCIMLQFFYENNSRVEVLDTVGHFHYLTHGDWLIGVNHGDKVKSANLVSMMARDHPGWSAAKFRLWLVGHIHHERAVEIGGCVVRSFNTLAPRDAWHTLMGYGASQSMSLLTFHKTKGMHSTLEYNLPI